MAVMDRPASTLARLERMRDVLGRLNAANGRGFTLPSDHLVMCRFAGRTYECMVELVRKRSVYSLDPGRFDEFVAGEKL